MCYIPLNPYNGKLLLPLEFMRSGVCVGRLKRQSFVFEG